jgi:diaminohydroxyphosphoribosylaminopyrimidine deaminase/5-amino-6-(5-phosphoribosylamino)uracil reductase
MAGVVETKMMRVALGLARRGLGWTSPNPMVGALLVKRGEIIGRGWHHRAGLPHAEIEALQDAIGRGKSPVGAKLYVTLEPCSTHGRTPPCTSAIIAAGVKEVIAGATDPNPLHRGKGFAILRHAGMKVTTSVLEAECQSLNEAFNHWIVHRTPFVTVKAAMSIDGKIATASGESKWITGNESRAYAMKLRFAADAILVGINTILADDPSLTVRMRDAELGMRNEGNLTRRDAAAGEKMLRRIVLDSMARTPLQAKVVRDSFARCTTIVVSEHAPKKRVAPLANLANVIVAPAKKGKLDLRWLLKKLGAENVTQLLVEGGGEVNASCLLNGLAQRVAFFYAPKVIGGNSARKAVAGEGVGKLEEALELRDVEWKMIGQDLLMLGKCA